MRSCQIVKELLQEMKFDNLASIFETMGHDPLSFIPILNAFHEGVTIVDINGRILYMNTMQAAIDDIQVEFALGKTVTDLYRVDEGVSPTVQCLRTQVPVTNLAIYYRTQLGKIVNSIHNIYPIVTDGKLLGAIIFVKSYGQIAPHLSKKNRMVSRTLGEVNLVTVRSHKYNRNGTRFTFGDIVGTSPEFCKAVRSAKLASESPSPIMLYGETGTGKELFAQSIHNDSSRSSAPYVPVNCAAIPENLLEGILFGTAKGAFTGAIDKEGLIEQAQGGTLFLDEVNSMSVGLQAKLLRVLQERKVRRVGALRETDVNVKLVSSVNEDPHESIRKGVLRSDLMYRLGVVFISIPPLRNRQEDIDLLCHHFVFVCSQLVNTNLQEIDKDVIDLFHRYSWPGNVRELEHVIEGASNMVQKGKAIRLHHLTVHLAGNMLREESPDSLKTHTSAAHDSDPLKTSKPDSGRLDFLKRNQDFEKSSIISAISAAEGNASLAARKLGISPQLLHYKLKRYKIQAKDYKPNR